MGRESEFYGPTISIIDENFRLPYQDALSHSTVTPKIFK